MHVRLFDGTGHGGNAIPLVLAALLVGCATSEPQERFVAEGECPAVSPDGARLAFHRSDAGLMKVGVCPVEGGDVEWIEAGPAMAAYPAWSPAGALVYTYGQEKGTAYEVHKGLAKPEGYGLRVREPDGAVRELATGYTRDYLPSFSPDGKTVFFSTTREVRSPSKVFSLAMSANLAKVPLDGSKPPEVILKPAHQFNSGMVQPVVSPNGKILAWQHMGQFNPDGWSVYVARLDQLDLDHAARLTPSLMTALAPRWHPSGRFIAFTGFMPDDPGWGVWLMDVSNFALRRLADGENPAFSPDGKWIYYDRDRKIYRHLLGATDYPTAADIIKDKEEADLFAPERVVWSKQGTGKEEQYNVASEDVKAGAGDVVFVRAKVTWNGKDDMQMFFIGEYAESNQGLLLYLGKNQELWFASRNTANSFTGVSKRLEKAGEYDLVGVRTRKGYYLSVNGARPIMAGSTGNLALKTPQTFRVGRGLKAGSSVKSVEVGFGWPKSVGTAAHAREEVFK